MELRWSENAGHREHFVAIRAVTTHRRGMLALIASRIADMQANIESIDFQERPGMMGAINLTISVHDLKQLEAIFDKVRSASPDIEVSRL